jgi:hypothetical protein
MKTILLLLSTAAVAASIGCGPAARTPEQYRDDTKSVLDTKSNDIRACYDGVLATQPGVQGRVTVKFDVEPEGGKIINVAVDPSGTTAPAPLADCVTKSIAGLGITPPDKMKGEGKFTWEFTAPTGFAPPKS